MLFSSPLFLFLYLPVLLGFYWLAGPKLRNPLLVAASLFFYMWGEGTYVLVMVAIIAINHLLGGWVHGLAGRRSARVAVGVAVSVNLGLLIAFKYANFLVDQVNLILTTLQIPPVRLDPVHLPLGIFFFTFHALSYVIDIARNNVQPGKPLSFTLYMTFFPHAIAGPILRYGDIAAQLEERSVTIAEFAEGVRRFILGLAKKMLVANTVAVTADAIFALPTGELTFGLAWLGVACYTLQIYFDFSGYSDIAIGLAKLFGIDFRENFDYPYTARSIAEFWRRWHISLSTWFRGYLYIPPGGNRRGPVRTYANLVAVFALCGLWHGPSWTFAVWGLFHGAFLVLERMGLGRMLESRRAVIRQVYAMLVVAVGWVLFRAATLSQACGILGAMAGLGHGRGREFHPWLYLDAQLVLALIAGILGSAPVRGDE
jgi:alginate O-acetyltransferase complex protein AlgI